jgi:hypothetical protein
MRKLLLLIASLMMPLSAAAQQYTISPAPFLLAQDNSGKIINNACVWTYTAGTTTAATTYADAAGTPNSNPIRSDSAGRFTAFLTPGSAYKYVYETSCTPPAHGTVLRTADNITAMPPSGVNLDVTGTAGESIVAGASVYLSDGSGGTTPGQWYNASATNSYSSSNALAVGMAVSAVSSTASGTFRISGRLTGLSGLTVGRYFVATGAGTITATEPANSRFVGVADSTTSLVIGVSPATTQVPDSIADGRLSASTGTCVPTADFSGIATIFYTPCTGNRLALYTGNVWVVRTFTEISISVSTCSASKPYDVFAVDGGAAANPSIETLIWTSSTARATALARQDGVWVKSGAPTRRWLGSFYCNGSAGQTDDSLTKRSICNGYNRVPRALRRFETTATWTYTTATIREANAAAANQVEILACDPEKPTPLRLTLQVNTYNTNADVARTAGFGEDSTTTFMAQQTSNAIIAAWPAGADFPITAALEHYPAVGRHVYSWNEISAAVGTTTWVGVGSGNSAQQAGITGWIEY